MARVRCNSCGGEYDTVTADRVLYQHACGPRMQGDALVPTERPDKRDETIILGPDGRAIGIRAEGRGRVDIEPGA